MLVPQRGSSGLHFGYGTFLIRTKSNHAEVTHDRGSIFDCYLTERDTTPVTPNGAPKFKRLRVYYLLLRGYLT